jgi:hypothetical protein
MLANMGPLAERLKRDLRIAVLAFVLAAPARADDLSDFHAAVEAAMSHHRVASGYLRTGNIDLAALEIEGLRESWGKVSALPRPSVFRDPQRYTATMLDVAARLIGTRLVLDLGRADVARESLDAVRRSLSELRRASGVMVLADCVLDANVSMDALFANDAKPDWESVTAGAESHQATLQRCDRMAPPAIRNHAEFRRLIDGSLASLAQVGKAVETRDTDLLHRLLIELRSFDHLLAFRHG